MNRFCINDSRKLVKTSAKMLKWSTKICCAKALLWEYFFEFLKVSRKHIIQYFTLLKESPGLDIPSNWRARFIECPFHFITQNPLPNNPTLNHSIIKNVKNFRLPCWLVKYYRIICMWKQSHTENDTFSSCLPTLKIIKIIFVKSSSNL